MERITLGIIVDDLFVLTRQMCSCEFVYKLLGFPVNVDRPCRSYQPVHVHARDTTCCYHPQRGCLDQRIHRGPPVAQEVVHHRPTTTSQMPSYQHDIHSDTKPSHIDTQPSGVPPSSVADTKVDIGGSSSQNDARTNTPTGGSQALVQERSRSDEHTEPDGNMRDIPWASETTFNRQHSPLPISSQQNLTQEKAPRNPAYTAERDMWHML